MNHAGEITPLVGFVRPHVALVTTIGPVHIEHLGSIEAIADAKAEIFSGLEPGGAAVLNRDAPQFERLAARRPRARAQPCSFGASAGGDARLLIVRAAGRGLARRAPRSPGSALDFTLGAPGRHMAENAVGVLLALDALGAPLHACAAGAGRLRAARRDAASASTLQAPGGPLTLIDESYNANPASMRAALALLGATQPGPGGRRIAVHRRHAGAGRRGRGDARRARGRSRGQPRRSAVRRRAADARAVRRRAGGVRSARRARARLCASR